MFHAKTTGAFISAAADDPPFPPDPAQIHLILPNALLLSFYPTMKLTAAAILSLAGFASAETFFKEQFDDVSVVSSIHFLWSTIINQVGIVRHFSIRLVREFEAPRRQ